MLLMADYSETDSIAKQWAVFEHFYFPKVFGCLPYIFGIGHGILIILLKRLDNVR